MNRIIGGVLVLTVVVNGCVVGLTDVWLEARSAFVLGSTPPAHCCYTDVVNCYNANLMDCFHLFEEIGTCNEAQDQMVEHFYSAHESWVDAEDGYCEWKDMVPDPFTPYDDHPGQQPCYEKVKCEIKELAGYQLCQRKLYGYTFDPPRIIGWKADNTCENFPCTPWPEGMENPCPIE
ncbi:MAG: hypothetical protein KDA69_03920 [Planctomycetaceae bacterium]|nr:hypothetical protein [Planctomycetaceae bacterium]MCA9043440.1 hypothetical protein [Planctomycetaceae bacterium]MCB9954037.1 hypothetical protein [Planctomycetaceae bacterium]